jgi:hypothetical protein
MLPATPVEILAYVKQIIEAFSRLSAKLMSLVKIIYTEA